MERFSSRESVLLGYSPSGSFAEDPGGSSSKSSSSFSDAVVDFHDVFGGPPRRVSVQEGRYSINSEGGGSVEEGVGRRGSDEAARILARRSPWGGLGFGEKPVFGEGGSGTPRRKTSDDFFDDIFRGGGSGDSASSTVKRAERDSPSSSVQLDDVVMPRGDAFGGSSVAPQSSIPANLGKGMEFPGFTSVSRSPRRSRENYPPSSRLSRHGSENQGDLSNEAQLFYHQSSLSVEFSFANNGSIKVTKSEKGDGEDIVKQNSTISDSLVNSSQFHFSIYKWASKGAPPMIPIRGGVNFRLRDKSIKKSLNDDGKLEGDVETEQAAANVGEGLDSVSVVQKKDSKSSRLTMKEKDSETTSTMKSKGVLDDDLNLRNVEETKVDGHVPDPLISSANIIQDTSYDFNYHEIRARSNPRSVADLMKLEIKEDETRETEKENQKSGANTEIHENEGQAENQTILEVGGKTKGTTIFSRFASFGTYIKKQDGKGTASDTNSDADKTSVPSSPGESSRRRKVKEKVKEFVEMFNQDNSSKSKMDAETHSSSSEWIDKGTDRAKGSVPVSTKKAGKDVPKSKLDKKFESSDASQMVDKKIKPEIMSTVVDKKKMSPNASAKAVEDIASPKAKNVMSHKKVKSSAAPITDQKKETFVSDIKDKKITPPTKVKMDSPKAKKFTSQSDDTDTDTNFAFQVAPTIERKKEAYQNDPAMESKKTPLSNSVKVDKKMEQPNNQVDRYIKQEKQDYPKESSTTVPKDTPSKQKDVSSAGTGSLPDMYQDANESLFDPIDAFEIKELTEELSNLTQMDEYQQALQDSDTKIRQWSRGKEGNIRSLLSTLQHILWPGSGWKPVALMDIIEANQVKRTYQRALLCLHPDKLQQKGAAEHQKYIAGKVFDILQESWNHFNTLTSL